MREFSWALRSDGVSWEYEGDADKVEKEASIGEFQAEVLAYLQEHDFAGPTEIAKALESSKGNVARALVALQKRGLVAQGSGAKVV